MRWHLDHCASFVMETISTLAQKPEKSNIETSEKHGFGYLT